MNDDPILLTGASGFIGGNFCRYLLGLYPGRPILALVRSQSDLPQGITQIVVQDWSLRGLLTALDGRTCDTIFHLAAYGVRPSQTDASHMLMSNTILPNTMVALAKALNGALISVGSNSEYALARQGRAVDEYCPLQTINLYGASKAAGGLISSAYAAACNVPYSHLRLFNVFGPGEPAHRLLPTLTAGLAHGRRVALSDGMQLRDFIHIDDVCKALVAASQTVRKLRQPETFNICTGWAHSVRTFAETACDILGGEHHLLGFGDLDRRRGEPPVLVGDPTRAEAVLGFRARTNLKAGLARTIGRKLEAA